MEKQKNPSVEKIADTSAETVDTTQDVIEETCGRRKIYKDQDFYPVCAIIMCICAAVGDLVARYIFKGAFDGLAVGMIVGVVCAIIFIKKGGKQLDTSPTKERTKKKK